MRIDQLLERNSKKATPKSPLSEVMGPSRPVVLPDTDTVAQLCNLEFPSSPHDDLFLPASPKILMKGKNPVTSAGVPPTIHLATSLIKKDQMGLIGQFCERFSFCVQLQDQFIPHLTTHLVTPCTKLVAKRSFKYLSAILSGSWIISTEWIAACLNSNVLIDCEEWEVAGDEHFSEEEGPRRARLSRWHQEPPLMSGLSFYLYGKFSAPGIDELSRLILQAGGSLIDSVDKLPKRQSSTSNTIVLCDPKEQTDFEKDAGVLAKYRPLLSTSWLLDSISCYQVLDRRDHIVL